jgi:hypothetical protein
MITEPDHATRPAARGAAAATAEHRPDDTRDPRLRERQLGYPKRARGASQVPGVADELMRALKARRRVDDHCSTWDLRIHRDEHGARCLRVPFAAV